MRGPDVPPAVLSRWEEFMADQTATAEEFREDGFEVLEFHPGQVLAKPSEGIIDILAPSNEFRPLREQVEAGFTVDEYAFYAAEEGSVRFVLVVALDRDREVAVSCPVYLTLEDVVELSPVADEQGGLDLAIRPLSPENRVLLTIEQAEQLLGTD